MTVSTKFCLALIAACLIGAARYPLMAQDAPAPAAPATQPAADTAPAAFGSPLFTDDFESGSLDRGKWDLRVAGNATVTVQSDNAGHGKYALQSHYPAGTNSKSYGFIVAAHLPEAVREHLFARAYMFAGPTPPPGHDPAILAGTPGWPISNFIELGLHGLTLQPSFQENGANVPRGETVKRTQTNYPLGKWFCMEWEFNDKPDGMNVWIDGKLVQTQVFAYKGSATGLVNSAADKGFAELGLGFRAWGNGTKADFDLYYDDIAIGTQRIGPIK